MRRNDLDYARGIAILLILIGHADGISEGVLKAIYSFHVPLFFLISGILMKYSHAVDKSWKQLVSRWGLRLILPTVFWEAVFTLFYYLIRGTPLRELMYNSITLKFNLGVLWFIPCLLAAEAVWVFVLKFLSPAPSLRACMAWALVFMIAGQFVTVLFPKRVLVASAFVITGYGLETLREKKIWANISCSSAIICVSFVIWAITMWMNVRADLSAGILGKGFLYYAHSLCGSIAVITLCNFAGSGLHILGWVGKYSMGFLVTHIFVRYTIISLEEIVFGCFWGEWLLAIPMIFLDGFVVWVITKIAPETIGCKRVKEI